MQLAEFESLRAGIRRSDEELAAELGVSAARLQQWRSGRERIPKYEARLLRFIAASQDRGRALEESGLPECVWMAEFDAVDLPSDSDAMLAALKRAEVHHGSCSVCLARERFVNDQILGGAGRHRPTVAEIEWRCALDRMLLERHRTERDVDVNTIARRE